MAASQEQSLRRNSADLVYEHIVCNILRYVHYCEYRSLYTPIEKWERSYHRISSPTLV